MGIFKRISAAFTKPIRIRRRRQAGKISRRAYYQAAEIGRLTNAWKRQTASADAEICNELSTIRNRARDLARNNDYAKRFLNLVTKNVIGPAGIHMQAKPIYAIDRPSGKAGEVDRLAKPVIENAWKTWCKLGNCTVDGTQSFVDVQSLVLKSIARDGDIAIRTVSPFPNKWGFALQILEPEYLDETYNANLANGNMVRMGVELNEWRRPIAYHFLTKHPGDIMFSTNEITRRSKRIRIPAEEIIHPYIRDRSNQTRGVSWFVTPAYRLQMLGGYEEAELVASRVSSTKMGFFKSLDGDEGFEGEGTSDDDGHEAYLDAADPGAFEKLPNGVDFVKWDPDHPTTAFEAFVLAVLRGVSSGLDVSYVSLANDLRSVSYSSIRQGTIDERDAWRMLQGWTIEHVCTVIFDRWLKMALLTGAVPLPARKYEKFQNVVWRARGWQWVDPQKEVMANKIAVREGFKSPQQIAAEQGRTLEEILTEIAQAKEIASSLGLYIPVLHDGGKDSGGGGAVE